MGGYHLLSQRMHARQAQKLILSGQKYKAEKLSELGLVDHLAEKNEGREAVYDYVQQHSKYRNGHLAVQKVRNKVHAISYEELMEVCNIWV